MTHDATRIILLTMVAALLTSSGCAGKRLGADIRAGLMTVSINPEVAVPDTIDTHDLSLPLLFGLVGAVVDQVSARSASKQLRDVLANNGIDFGQITYETFRSQLANTRAFNITEPGQGTAQLTLSITSLRLARPIGSMDQLKPMVSILAVLAGADGTVLWRQADYVTNLNEQTPAFPFDDCISQPENLRTAFTRAIQIVTSALVANLTES